MGRINQMAPKLVIKNPSVSNRLPHRLFKTRGFTFIELLVVLLIISVISGALVLGVGFFSERHAAKSVAERLYHLLPLVREQAVLHGQVIKLELKKDQYAFYALTNGRTDNVWSLITKPTFLAPQKISHTLSIQLKEIQSALHTEINDDESRSLLKNDINIEFLPTMEMDPFVLTIGTKKAPNQYELSVQKNGVVKLRSLP